MILVDTGPLVAIFDPKDGHYARCRSILKSSREPLLTTVPVLTEAFHLLTPGSKGALALGSFFIVPTVPVGTPLTTLCVACEGTRSVRGGIPTQSVRTMTNGLLAGLGYLK